MEQNYVITIARGYGSGGKTIGKMLSEELGINYYDRQLIRMASDDSGIHERLFGAADERVRLSNHFRRGSGAAYTGKILPPESSAFVSDDNLFSIQAKIIKQLAEKENCIVVGRCADFILKDRPNVVKLFVYAPYEYCVTTAMEVFGTDRKETERNVRDINRYRGTYYKHYTGRDWNNASNYDLCLNSEQLGFQKCVDIVRAYLDIRFR